MPYEELYRSFPEEGHKCPPDCGQCCVSDVWVARSEAEAICEWLVKNIEMETIVKQFHHYDTHPWGCPFLTPAKRCLVYPVRPFVCRQFGHLENPPGAPPEIVSKVSQKCPRGIGFTEVRIEPIRKLLEEWYTAAREAGIPARDFRDGLFTDETGKEGPIPRRGT